MSVDDDIAVDVLAVAILVDIISIDATMVCVDVTSKDFTLAGVTMIDIPGTVEQYN